MQVKYFSMFSGIGGFELGIQRALLRNKDENLRGTTGEDRDSEGQTEQLPKFGLEGLACIGYSEIDKHAIKVYERNFNGHKNYGDATGIDPAKLPDFELLVGGFPCQSFSIAGKRAGFDDTRGTLFFDIARILKHKRPGHFVLENVRGLLSHGGGQTLNSIFEVLSDLGYRVEWQVLNSKDFGVPQNRERIYIVGHLGNGCRGQVFPIIGTNDQIISPDAKVRIGTLRTHKDGNGFREVKSGVSPTIPARAREDGSGQPVVALTEVRTEEAKEVRRQMRKQGKDFSPRRGKNLVARADAKVGAITASRNLENLITDTIRIRRLTPRECERLQGFPDDWTEEGLSDLGEPVPISDTQRYKMCGNAVTVNVVQAVMERMCTL